MTNPRLATRYAKSLLDLSIEQNLLEAVRHGVAPTAKEADQSLQRMIESVKTGSFGAFIPFGRDGEPVLFG